jgi:hypothetical protein
MNVRPGVSLAAVVALVTAAGCHRVYEVRGSVNVVPSVARRAQFPAVVCTAFGDPSGDESPMTYAVTFDPDHKTWDDGAQWIERRTLTIE